MANAVTAEQLLRQRGLRVTPQRQAILQLLLDEEGSHWSADQVRARLQPEMPGLARGTIYKVLEEFVKAGLCEELPTAENMAVYGLRLTPHHHFVCNQCGRWFDVEVQGIDALSVLAGPPDARVDEVAVVFRGLCRDCQVSHSVRG
ncbi:MAG: Fur family transcriptional regulator [Firmicutes bacterium]|nr:Fur family transcriptional regulator [Bacillota bacterium]